MCGIAGIFGLEQVDQPREKLGRMLDAISHRGPDAQGIEEKSQVLLGHRRLSIIDLSDSANQPMISSDGRYTLIFNGELYNFLELRQRLNHYSFKTKSDTEVVLAAFAEWGVRCLQEFNGMFALAIWDQEKEQLFIARDRIGIKPLYYAQPGQSFVFSSELRAMMKSGLVARKLNRAVLSEYLTYQTVHAPATMIEGVSMLPPAHYMVVSDQETKMQRYWLPWQEAHDDQDEEVVKKNIRERFFKAVEARLVADVPFGAFLSGGIDSSLIVAAMSQEMDRPVDTFNVSFDESEFSESRFARMIAEKYQCNHHEVRLKPAQFLDSLPDALGAMDHPSGDGPNTWVVSRETKRLGITMALSGLGGDELFAGYDVFTRIPKIADQEWILSFPKGLRRLAANVYQSMKPGIVSEKMGEVLTSDYYDLIHTYPIMRKVLLKKQLSWLLEDNQPQTNNLVAQLQEWSDYRGFEQLPVLTRISISEMSTYMQNTLLRDTDQMAMAHALEVRVPFLDHKLVEYMMHVDDGLKFPHTPKKLLVDSFSELLPDEVVNRPKMGFTLPWEQWMRKELKDFCRERLDRLAQVEGFKAEGIEQLWKAFETQQTVNWSRVWHLVSLSDWMIRNDVE